MDEIIEDEAGMSVAEIFRLKGERVFRVAEHRALRRVTREGGRVVALGGGTVCFPGNRELIHRSGRVVVLTATPERICRRIGRLATRPLLAGPGGRERMLRLLEERRADYRRYRLRVATDGLTPAGVAAAIINRIENIARNRTCTTTVSAVHIEGVARSGDLRRRGASREHRRDCAATGLRSARK